VERSRIGSQVTAVTVNRERQSIGVMRRHPRLLAEVIVDQEHGLVPPTACPDRVEDGETQMTAWKEYPLDQDRFAGQRMLVEVCEC